MKFDGVKNGGLAAQSAQVCKSAGVSPRSTHTTHIERTQLLKNESGLG